MNHKTSLEHLIMRHDEEIDHIKEDHHKVELNILEIKSDIKTVLNKLDGIQDTLIAQEERLKLLEDQDNPEKLGQINSLLNKQDIKLTTLETSIKVLEGFYNKRQKFIGILYTIVNIIYKCRWGLIFIFLVSFAVDVDFRISNPQLLDYLLAKIPPIFHK